MTQQSGGNKDQAPETFANQVAQGATTAIDRTTEFASDALDRADEWLKPMGLSIKERPGTCLAVVSGIAFAAGALWMLRSTRHQSYPSTLAAQLSNYGRRFR